MVVALSGCAGPKQVALQGAPPSRPSQAESDLAACQKIALEKVADVDRFRQSTHDLKEVFGAAYLLDRVMESADADARRRRWTQSCMQDKGHVDGPQAPRRFDPPDAGWQGSDTAP